jgi:hypothetical protein
LFRAIIKVINVEIDPMHRDRTLRWMVICRVEEVIQGTLPEGISELTLLVLSPSKAFGDVEIARKKYTVDFFLQ